MKRMSLDKAETDEGFRCQEQGEEIMPDNGRKEGLVLGVGRELRSLRIFKGNSETHSKEGLCEERCWKKVVGSHLQFQWSHGTAIRSIPVFKEESYKVTS